MVTRQTIERDLGMKWAQIKKLPGLPAMTSITVKGKKVEVLANKREYRAWKGFRGLTGTDPNLAAN
ncbi:MAG: hypothetical protein HN396_10830 [Gemmatimonadales bacterium]|jgi:hypothetical protein|nr:hypothetical protein [Gemmatimonadales bacterium]